MSVNDGWKLTPGCYYIVQIGIIPQSFRLGIVVMEPTLRDNSELPQTSGTFLRVQAGKP
jgi:hypothetical protein